MEADGCPVRSQRRPDRTRHQGPTGAHKFEGGEGEYRFTQELDGTKHFGLWPLSEAATACFGTTEWPSEIPVPQASIEFEVADVAAAADELKAKGYRLIHEARTEPWKQITARLLSPRRPTGRGLLHAVVPRSLRCKQLTTATTTGDSLSNSLHQPIDA